MIRHPTERPESGRGSGSGSAPADEERYRELVKENEELQKLIAQVIINQTHLKDQKYINDLY